MTSAGRGLRGITWDHPRGYAALAELERLDAEGDTCYGAAPVPLTWDRQSLAGFESHPITDLARRYDLLVIDHPGLGPAMAALQDMGVWVGVAGNQTSRAGEILRKLDLPADMIATSDDWGAVKPDASFFRAVIDSAPCRASEIVYVGDRVDNDLKPAREAGMLTAFIRRGPWGYIWERHPDMAAVADWRMTTLAELPGIVAGVNRSAR